MHWFLLTALLPLLTPDDVSTNPIAPDILAPTIQDANLGWNPSTQNFAGLSTMICYGNAPLACTQQVQAQSATNCTVSNLDTRLPWWFSAYDFYEPGFPISTNCIGNGALCITNWMIKSDLSPPVLLADSNLQPFLYLSNNIAFVIGWGSQGLEYHVFSGTNVQSMTNDVFDPVGTNGPWQYSEVVTNQKFFKILSP